MNRLEKLAECAGAWRGTNRLQDPHTHQPDESPGSALVTSVLGGAFVRLDYTWVYRGSPQEGSMLFGHLVGSGTVTAQWIDTWHMADKLMACLGTADPTGVLSVHGYYAAPPGPDWSWRIVVTPDGQGSLRVVMYNITPEGQEELAVEATYARR